MRGRRGHRLTALAVVLVVVFAACGGGGGKKSATKGTSAPSSGGQVDANGVLRYGLDFTVSLTNTFDRAASQSTCETIVLKYIYDTLLNVESGNLKPGLAESWKQEGNTLTLALRKGLTFQDGTLLDAQAVKT